MGTSLCQQSQLDTQSYFHEILAIKSVSGLFNDMNFVFVYVLEGLILRGYSHSCYQLHHQIEYYL